VVSEATVKTHVAGILAKLDLRNRAQAVVFAYETGIVRASLAAAAGERWEPQAGDRIVHGTHPEG
jgi:hypothetical protein